MSTKQTKAQPNQKTAESTENICAMKRLMVKGTLGKSRRQRQRERHKTKGLMSKTIAVHVRYNPLYIS